MRSLVLVYIATLTKWLNLCERRTHTFIFIDEIYLLFQHEYSANFLFTLWKRVRKYGGVLYGYYPECGRPVAEPYGEDNACKL